MRDWEEEKKFNRAFYTVGVIMFIGMFVFIFAILQVADDVGNSIEENGGVGKSIGKFIKDIQSEIE